MPPRSCSVGPGSALIKLQGCLIGADPPVSRARPPQGGWSREKQGTLIKMMPDHLLRTRTPSGSGLAKIPIPFPLQGPGFALIRLQGCLISADPPCPVRPPQGGGPREKQGTLTTMMPDRLLRSGPLRGSGLAKIPPRGPRPRACAASPGRCPRQATAEGTEGAGERHGALLAVLCASSRKRSW